MEEEGFGTPEVENHQADSITSKFSTINKDDSWNSKPEENQETLRSDIWDIEEIVDKI